MARIRTTARGFLRFALIILIITVGLLSYILYVVSQPPAEVYKSPKLTHVLSIYGYGSRPEEQLKRPHDVAFDKQGRVYISDTGNRRILVFSQNGRFIRAFGSAGTGRGEFVAPLGIAVGDNGYVYVADESAGKVVIFSSSGEFIREIRVMMPLKPFVFKNRLYLTNYAFVNIYDLSGRHLLDRWGGKGRDKGQFDLPTGIVVTGKDNIYVADLGNLRIQALDRKGKVKWVIGSPESQAEDRRFGLPSGIVADEEERLYVVDAFNHQIEAINTTGASLAKISEEGQKEGQLYYPAGIAYAGQDLFAIADKFNNRVQLIRINVDGK